MDAFSGPYVVLENAHSELHSPLTTSKTRRAANLMLVLSTRGGESEVPGRQPRQDSGSSGDGPGVRRYEDNGSIHLQPVVRQERGVAMVVAVLLVVVVVVVVVAVVVAVVVVAVAALAVVVLVAVSFPVLTLFMALLGCHFLLLVLVSLFPEASASLLHAYQ